MEELLAADTGRTVEQIHRDTQRDTFMTAEEAKEYGLIDDVIEARPQNRKAVGLG
jgi:ATP-dependent Clp protease protease subunit